ncbi:MAG: hypothetical protein IRY99_00710 [Isosphaeraceae bacterium]|nr:hypothetical protein [Isosphaeraceae bacterium]
MIDRMRDDLASQLGPQSEQLKERALELTATARERLAQGAQTIREYTIQNPARALGLALGMGVILGWLIKRR